MKLRTNPKRTAKALTTGGSKRPVVVGPAPRGRPPGSTKASAAKAVAAVFKKNKPGPKSHHLKQNLTRSKSATAAASPGPQSAETTEDEDKSPTREVETRSSLKSKAQEVDQGSKSVDVHVKSEEQSEEAETEESGDEKMEEEDSGVSDSAAGAAEASPPQKNVEATVEQEKQLVVKLDKIDVQRPKRSTAGIQQRKLSEDSSKESGSRRSARQQMKAKNDEQAGGTSSDKDKDKDERSFERFYTKVKETSVVSERWSFGGVLWDPTKKTKVMAASEVDVTSSGNMRLRRCVQVFEDMTVRVMIEGADMTSTFSSTGSVKNVNEVAQLIHKVATSKICSGIKNFGSTDKVYFPHCVLRGESYFAPECPIVIDYGVVGPLCPHCNRLRNMIARRNIKETNLLYSKFNRAPVKNIRSGFGKQLYSMLTDMIEASSVDAKKERKKLRRMIPANAKEYPFRGTITSVDGVMIDENQQIQLQQHPLQIQLAQQMQHQQQLQKFIQSDSSGNITISSIAGGNTIVNTSSGSSQEYIRLGKSYGGQSEMMTFNVVSSGGPRGTFKMAREGQGSGSGSSGSNFPTTIGGTVLTPGEMHMVEQLVLQEGHDVGNVIIQNSGDFTLAEGQEYELIGEADPNNPIQVLEVLKEQNESNNTIEIIEVDDQTLAQLTSQNLSNFIIQEPSGDFEVQEIDANDPNFRHLVKALNPSAVVYQT